MELWLQSDFRILDFLSWKKVKLLARSLKILELDRSQELNVLVGAEWIEL